jgi:CRISPR-associated protein Csx10
MKRIHLQITALSPLAIGRQKPGGSVSEAETYIPGSVLRGAIAALMLRQSQLSDTDFTSQSDSDFKALFIDGKALFLNAYPALTEIDDALQMQPGVDVLPATALSAKNGGGFRPKNGVFDSLLDRFCASEFAQVYDPSCPTDGGRVDPFKGFYSKDNQDRYHSHTVSTRLLTRVGINRRRATAEEAILYSIEVLEESKKHTPKIKDPQLEPMIFTGSILVEENYAQGLLDYIQRCSREFRLGNSASRGLGKVKIDADDPVDITSDIQARAEAFNNALNERWSLWRLFGGHRVSITDDRLLFSLDLYSDAILTENWLRTTVLSEMMLQTRLQDLLNESGSGIKLHSDVKLHTAYSSYDYRSGWNAAWGLMKDTELTTDRGSVYLFSVDRMHQEGWLEGLQLLEQRGIGDRTSEGFGQVKVCDEFHCVFRENPV